MLSKLFRGSTKVQSTRNFSSALKLKMEEKIVTRQAEVKSFNKEFGKHVLGEVTVG